MLADGLEQILHGHGLATERARQDASAIDEDRRDVEAHHRHHHAGQGLVAAGHADEGVIGMAAHGQLDRIRDDLARRQRGLHALVTHGDAVGHRDGAELARRALSGGDALLHGLRLAHQRDVAGRGFVPAGGDADEWLVNLLLGQTHRVEVRTVRRASWAFRYVATWEFRFVEPARIHELHSSPLGVTLGPEWLRNPGALPCATPFAQRPKRVRKNPLAPGRRLRPTALKLCR